jgi:hypothetical protein
METPILVGPAKEVECLLVVTRAAVASDSTDSTNGEQ